MDRPAMPPTVIAAVVVIGAIVLLGLAVTLAAVAAASASLPIAVVALAVVFRCAIPLLFVVFLVRGHPLAHQWATLVSGFAVLIGVLGVVTAPDNLTRAVLAGYVALPLSVIVLLGREPSLRYFDLQCPACGAFRTKAKSFLFNAKGCAACGHRWNHRQGSSRATGPG